MEVVSFIVSIVVLFFVISLKKRVRHLEDLVISRGIAKREEVLYGAAAAPDEIPSSSRIPSMPEPVSVAQSAKPAHPSSFDSFVVWMREDWLMKLGALLLLIGFGWLVRYAFLNNWIGPAGRITLGIAAGVLFLLVGWKRIQTFTHQGSIFLALGSGVVLLSIFAARFLYDFFTPFSALVIMFLSTAFVAVASVRFRVRSLSLVSLALAGAVPLLTNSPSPDYIGLFTYLLVVVAGTLWIVAVTGWRILTPAALVLVVLYSMPHLVPGFGFFAKDRDVLLLFAYAFTGIFFISNTASIIRSAVKDIQTDTITAAGIGLFLLAWITQAAPAEWQSLLMAAWMVVFSAGAFLVFKATQQRSPFFAYAGVSVALLAAATAAELEGASLTIAYTLESALVALVIHEILGDIKAALRSIVLLAGPAVLSLQSFAAREWADTILHEHFFVILLFAVVSGGLGMFFGSKIWARDNHTVKNEEEFAVSAALVVVGSMYAYALLWLSLHAGFLNDDTAVMAALAIYTIIGIACYFSRAALQTDAIRMYGGALLGFVVGRLLIVDVWEMAIAGRIITFFLIGTLLISTAFLWRKKTLEYKDEDTSAFHI